MARFYEIDRARIIDILLVYYWFYFEHFICE